MTNSRKTVDIKALTLILFLISSSGAVAQSISKNVESGWKTYSESTNYRATPRYDETISFAKRLDNASDQIVYKSFGLSSEGRDLPLLIAANDNDFRPDSVNRKDKAVILIQAAIHSGESDGKDAGLALFRDIATTREYRSLLDHAVLLFIPIYNVDGHEMFSAFNRINQNGPEEMGFRANSANQNLNRDYMKADTSETRAWLRLWNEWNPDFFIDCHVTDGADFRYNITYEFAHNNEIATELEKWMGNYFEGSVKRKVEAEGNLLTRYLQFRDRTNPAQGVFTFIATPRFATGYTALRNRNGLLIEAHSHKPYESRVRGTYDVLRYTIEEVGKFRRELLDANAAADALVSRFGKDPEAGPSVVLRQRPSGKSEDFLFKGYEFARSVSPVTGVEEVAYTKKPVDLKIPRYDDAVVTASAKPPVAYIVPPQWREVIETLKAHGLILKRLPKAVTIEIESFRFEEPAWANAPFEGRITFSSKIVPITESRVFPKNSVVIEMGQPASAVAVHFLEPEGPDSAMYWGFFNAIFEQKEYSETFVMEQIARKMLQEDPDLRKEFEQKLKDDGFAGDPRARMRFFYERSPYFEERIGVYPVGRIVKTSEAAKLPSD